MKDLDLNDPKRRRLMQASLVMGGLGALLSVRAAAAQRSAISMQLGWVPGGGQVGEVVAKRLGFYEREGIDLKIEPGGPNIDGVAIVASGRGQTGQVSSSPSVMLAVSEDCRSSASPSACSAIPTPSFRWARTRSASLRT